LRFALACRPPRCFVASLLAGRPHLPPVAPSRNSHACGAACSGSAVARPPQRAHRTSGRARRSARPGCCARASQRCTGRRRAGNQSAAASGGLFFVGRRTLPAAQSGRDQVPGRGANDARQPDRRRGPGAPGAASRVQGFENPLQTAGRLLLAIARPDTHGGRRPVWPHWSQRHLGRVPGGGGRGLAEQGAAREVRPHCSDSGLAWWSRMSH